MPEQRSGAVGSTRSQLEGGKRSNIVTTTADEEKHDAARAVQASQATASEAEVKFE